ncbi:LysR family transcriptional regulator CbbR [Paralimibaculum aggregatum]|uniref:HTH-type transcriptional regulator CbbR n=1 Tax=Paralimibaculum aggregatum TaxID=3036245 RepID=A0ABQ6LJD2_9RHOB|nr:LysR family transcriptional regulator [Limibaculum sp. NKW23]GMG83359.1 LysR family transcriptional regulator CbbR [Limibaculum sp. NKW23]
MAHPKSLTLKQLRALAAIVETGSITAAAGTLHVTPPAVSTQLKSLEEGVCAQVLNRGPDGKVSLTPIGRELLGTVQKIETALSQCFARIEAMKAGMAGYVSIGVVSTGKYFAPGLVARMKALLPDVEIGLKVGNREAIVEALARGEVELAIMGRPPQEPPVEAEVLGEHPYIIIAPPDHPLALADDILPEALLEETFLGREQGSGTRILMRRYLDRIGEGRPYRMVEMGTNETIKQAVMAGLGLAVISAHTVVPELEAGRLVMLRMEGLPIIRHWYLVRPAEAKLSATSAAFRDFLMLANGDYLPKVPRPLLVERWEDMPV